MVKNILRIFSTNFEKMRFLVSLHTSYKVSGIPVGREPYSEGRRDKFDEQYEKGTCLFGLHNNCLQYGNRYMCC